MENTTKKTHIALHTWMIFSLLSAPGLSLASQLYEPDTAYVLIIDHYKVMVNATTEEKNKAWIKTNEPTYIKTGETVNMELENGDKFPNARITKIEKEFIVAGGESIPIASIVIIKVKDSPRRVITKMFRGIVALLGIILGIVWVGFYLFFEGGSEPDALFGAVILIPLAIFLFGISPFWKTSRFDFRKPRFTLGTAAISDLSPKVRKKLEKKSFLE
ncbi:MAG: hypothetical protein R3D00_08705 [Bacteroidia bacterium]